MSVFVTKADGTTELFEEKKLRRSLKKAGASNTEVRTIINQVSPTLHDGITTQKIYRTAFELLRSSPGTHAARYSMRRALFGLGPTGFPFEDFLARLFEAEGYLTKTRIQLQGTCATHELDVAAYRDTDSFVVEAKFHARPGIKSDLQVALYTYARREDLKAQKICKDDVCGIQDVLLATNTKFTRTAEKYAACCGLSLLSWNTPKGNTLQDRIERAGIYPVTVLSGLSQSHKRELLENGIIVCRDIVKNPAVLKSLSLSGTKLETVLTEARQLCK